MRTLMIIALSGLVGVASAQREHRKDVSPEERAQKISEKMKKELNLTDDQFEKVKTENLAFFNKQKTTHNKMEAVRTELKTNLEEHKTKMKGILDEEQYEKAKKMLEDKMEKRKKRRRKD